MMKFRWAVPIFCMSLAALVLVGWAVAHFVAVSFVAPAYSQAPAAQTVALDIGDLSDENTGFATLEYGAISIVWNGAEVGRIEPNGGGQLQFTGDTEASLRVLSQYVWKQVRRPRNLTP